MQIWPAIDLRGGKCVRLEQGDYERETVFGADPVAMAEHWVKRGARQLHLVDLDGARHGTGENRSAVAGIVAKAGVPCELGGGIRDESDVRFWLDLGLARLVIGTRAFKDPGWFGEMCERYPDRLALGLDARNGFVATDGWLETSAVPATDLAGRFARHRLAALIYTDIARDGMMSGPNFEGIAAIQTAMDRGSRVPVIASGGITTAEDVRKLAQLGVAGCIIGRTLYEGKLTIADALRAAENACRDATADPA
jgi:phosphoribosylformimino-5-aminoimidazole carboxamide ribotide isomerase